MITVSRLYTFKFLGYGNIKNVCIINNSVGKVF